MGKYKIYLDTSVLSFVYAYDAPRKRDITIKFLRELKKGKHQAYISDVVMGEIREAPVNLRKKLYRMIRNYKLKELHTNPEAEEIAKKYVKEKIIPMRYYADALHIAIAVTNSMDALVSWNLRHIVRLRTQIMVNKISVEMSMPTTAIYSPEEVIKWMSREP